MSAPNVEECPYEHIHNGGEWPCIYSRAREDLRDLRTEVYTLRPTVDKLYVERNAMENAMEAALTERDALRALLLRVHESDAIERERGRVAEWGGTPAELAALDRLRDDVAAAVKPA